MLIIPVDLQGFRIMVFPGIFKTRLNRRPDPHVKGMVDHLYPHSPGQRGGLIGRAVVDHQDVGLGDVGPNILEDPKDIGLFLISRDNNECCYSYNILPFKAYLGAGRSKTSRCKARKP